VCARAWDQAGIMIGAVGACVVVLALGAVNCPNPNISEWSLHRNPLRPSLRLWRAACVAKQFLCAFMCMQSEVACMLQCGAWGRGGLWPEHR
jgi:hypothetical protein